MEWKEKRVISQTKAFKSPHYSDAVEFGLVLMTYIAILECTDFLIFLYVIILHIVCQTLKTMSINFILNMKRSCINSTGKIESDTIFCITMIAPWGIYIFLVCLVLCWCISWFNCNGSFWRFSGSLLLINLWWNLNLDIVKMSFNLSNFKFLNNGSVCALYFE